MKLADGRTVPDLHLDRAVVDRCRALADQVTAQVLELVRRHTTVAIERTVLRLYGLHDAGPRGVPLVNLAVDALHERKLLGRGAAYWMGYVLRRGATDPVTVVDRIASLPPSPEPLRPDEERAMLEGMRREARANVDELLRRVKARNDLKASLGVGGRPDK
jgi:beta-lysine 5,6-aminomutase alpha subunit